MNTRKVMQIAGVALGIGCVVASMVAINRWQAARSEARQKTALEPVRQSPPRMAAPATVATSPTEPAASIRQIESPKTNHQVATQTIVAVKKPVPAKQTSVRDPLAREALSFVGADPDADEYWVAAINDPRLSADERQNLIEDLNEDGLSDPKHPGPEDLPLILSRIELIEELAPFAMDKVNLDAFKEAHKDLVNMVNGQPAQ
ncbi:MAG TPA: hypothetical protein VFC07_03370 [Verrucomicrobiae bacterium]|nr:hypothetical protein [Verrucomicrobiae bacterium]